MRKLVAMVALLSSSACGDPKDAAGALTKPGIQRVESQDDKHKAPGVETVNVQGGTPLESKAVNVQGGTPLESKAVNVQGGTPLESTAIAPAVR